MAIGDARRGEEMKYIVMIRDNSIAGYRRIGTADTLREAAKISEPGSEIWHEKRYREWQDNVIGQTFKL